MDPSFIITLEFPLPKDKTANCLDVLRMPFPQPFKGSANGMAAFRRFSGIAPPVAPPPNDPASFRYQSYLGLRILAPQPTSPPIHRKRDAHCQAPAVEPPLQTDSRTKRLCDLGNDMQAQTSRAGSHLLAWLATLFVRGVNRSAIRNLLALH